jgi:hypothetical protein
LSIVVLLGITALLLWAVLRQGAQLALQARGATELSAEQAPVPYAVLIELSIAAGVARPRLFVVPGGRPAGAVIRDQPVDIVAVAERVFEAFSGTELRGLLALLVASLTVPRTTHEEALSDRVFEIDRRAARLAGAPSVVGALGAVARLEDAVGHEPAGTPRLWSMAVRANGGLPSVLSIEPSTAARIRAVELLAVVASSE